jgi:predicted NUDIX family NTP pyrophosphohydrolase
MKNKCVYPNYSAGILLYRYNNNQLEFLLGKDVKYNSWSDFGGKYDSVDNKNPLYTAIREFYEETCGVIMNMYEMEKIIKLNNVRVECMSYKKKNILYVYC